MNKEIKEQWIKALRSGEYNQTTQMLHNGDGYCCLGVLCDISNLGDWQDVGVYKYVIKKNGGESAGTLPQVVEDWAEVISHRVDLEDVPKKDSDHPYSLAELNDAGFTFDQIADVIDYFL